MGNFVSISNCTSSGRVKPTVMLTARQKRKENIAEYILYMWQVEDIIRALGLSDEAIGRYVREQYRLDEPDLSRTEEWYLSLADQMRSQGLSEAGHLPQLSMLVDDLQELSDRLLRTPSQAIYSTLYFRTLPSLIQLRERSGHEGQGEIETAFVGVYGYLTLRARQETIGEETTAAIKQISTFLAMLADRYHAVESGEIILEE